jgi:tetratricopeptide (TPR) repeat protein
MIRARFRRLELFSSAPKSLSSVRSITSFRYQIVASIVLILCLQATGAETGRNSPLLRRAFELSDLNNWTEAEPEFARAASAFRNNGDKTGLNYAELGIIRATIQRRNLALTSAQLSHRLESDPLMKSDRDLRIFAWRSRAKSITWAAAMRRDWEEVARLSRDSSDPRWRYRASAELGMAAYYEGNLQAARRNISAALIAATKAHDVGSQIKYLYAIGVGLNQAQMYPETIQYLDKAIALAKATPGGIISIHALAGEGAGACINWPDSKGENDRSNDPRERSAHKGR